MFQEKVGKITAHVPPQWSRVRTDDIEENHPAGLDDPE
jgi:hypothetical protein